MIRYGHPYFGATARRDAESIMFVTIGLHRAPAGRWCRPDNQRLEEPARSGMAWKIIVNAEQIRSPATESPTQKGLARPMLLAPMEPPVSEVDAKFAAPTSMRDTEPSVHRWLRYGLEGSRGTKRRWAKAKLSCRSAPFAAVS